MTTTNQYKYVLRPGIIQSADGQMQHIGADAIIRLYQVQPEKCLVLQNNDRGFEEKLCRYASKGYIFLYPRSDANYSWLHGKNLRLVSA